MVEGQIYHTISPAFALFVTYKIAIISCMISIIINKLQNIIQTSLTKHHPHWTELSKSDFMIIKPIIS